MSPFKLADLFFAVVRSASSAAIVAVTDSREIAAGALGAAVAFTSFVLAAEERDVGCVWRGTEMGAPQQLERRWAAIVY